MKKLLMTTCLGLALIALSGCGEEKPVTQGDGLIHTSKTKCESGKCESGKCAGAKKEASSKKCSTAGKCGEGKCGSKTPTPTP
ncbi:MAG TPA: hypothetical protein ENK39_06280 [Epsilonproteobacteria bacterium]|nr:hypothetical protein [Campylobacterota bacterium]